MRPVEVWPKPSAIKRKCCCMTKLNAKEEKWWAWRRVMGHCWRHGCAVLSEHKLVFSGYSGIGFWPNSCCYLTILACKLQLRRMWVCTNLFTSNVNEVLFISLLLLLSDGEIWLRGTAWIMFCYAGLDISTGQCSIFFLTVTVNWIYIVQSS